MRVHKKWRPRVLRSLKAVKQKRLSSQQLQQGQLNTTPDEEEQSKPAPRKNKYYSEKTCEICERKFVNGKTLSKHIKTVHNKIKPFICNVCGKKTARKASLIVSKLHGHNRGCGEIRSEGEIIQKSAHTRITKGSQFRDSAPEPRSIEPDFGSRLVNIANPEIIHFVT